MGAHSRFGSAVSAGCEPPGCQSLIRGIELCLPCALSVTRKEEWDPIESGILGCQYSPTIQPRLAWLDRYILQNPTDSLRLPVVKAAFRKLGIK
jgi:hypothetical protein